MDNILLLDRLRNIKDEALKAPEVYRREAHKYFDEFLPILESLLKVGAVEPVTHQPVAPKPAKKK